MEDKVLHNTLSQRMKSFYEEYSTERLKPL